MRRTLSLESETLRELTADQLGDVAGGALPTTPVTLCWPFTHFSHVDCITQACTS